MQIAFGREESNAMIIMGLIKHIVHHRGQITILMRQAGIKPFGVYRPPKEDWIHLGVEKPPTIITLLMLVSYTSLSCLVALFLIQLTDAVCGRA